MDSYDDSLTCLTFSPDSTRVAAGFVSGAVIVLDLTGHIEHALSGHTSRVDCVSFSPDGKEIVSCGHDKTARVWDAAAGSLIHTLSGHQDAIVTASFSPDGETLATGCRDGQILLWNVTSGKQASSFGGENRQLRAMSFDADGGHIFALHGSYVTLWSVESARKVHEWQVLPGSGDSCRRAAFSPEAYDVAIFADDPDGISVFRCIGDKPVRISGLHDEAILCLAFSPDGQRVLAGSVDQLKLWDLTQPPTSLPVGSVRDYVLGCMALSADGSRLATSLNSETEKVSIWNTRTGERLATLGDSSSPHVKTRPAVFDLALSSDAKVLATALQDKTIRLWRIADQKRIATLRGHTDFVLCVAFSSDGKYLASGSADNTVRLWDVGTNSNILVLRGHEAPIVAVAFNPDGRRCASGSRDGTVRLWDVMSGKDLATLRGHTATVAHLAFSQDGRQLVSESLDGSLRVWDTTIRHTGFAPQARLTIWDSDEDVRGVTFSPEGNRIVNGLAVYDAETGVKLCELPGSQGTNDSGVPGHNADSRLSADGKCLGLAGLEQVHLRSAERRQHVLSLPLWHNAVRTVAIGPDGTRIASGDSNHMVQLSDATTGQQTTRLFGHKDSVVCSAFNHDGKLLATGSEDNTVIIWDVETGLKRWSLNGHRYSVCFVGFRSADRKHVITGERKGGN